MKYEVISDGVAKDGRHLSVGSILELDKEYAEHLINRCLIQPVNFEKSKNKKNRATSKPDDLEQAVTE